MKFQILDTEGNALSMGELDRDAARFFNVPYDKKKYAKPSMDSVSWYNPVGWAITDSGKGILDWIDVIAQMLTVCPICTNSIEELEISFRIFKPYIELCYHWKSKGYIPVCL